MPATQLYLYGQGMNAGFQLFQCHEMMENMVEYQKSRKPNADGLRNFRIVILEMSSKIVDENFQKKIEKSFSAQAS
jgi:hypothetical protein